MNQRAVASIAVFLGACATSHVTVRGTLIASDPILEPNIRRTTEVEDILREASVDCGAAVELDRGFEARGFDVGQPVFRTRDGQQCVIRLTNGRTTLLVALNGLQPGLHDDFIPHLWTVRAEGPVISAMVCKGGTGRVTLSADGGTLFCRLACRVYANGTELEETTIAVEGSFEVDLDGARDSH